MYGFGPRVARCGSLSFTVGYGVDGEIQRSISPRFLILRHVRDENSDGPASPPTSNVLNADSANLVYLPIRGCSIRPVLSRRMKGLHPSHYLMRWMCLWRWHDRTIALPFFLTIALHDRGVRPTTRSWRHDCGGTIALPFFVRARTTTARS